ncbi:DegT/DnrJ/EryC1/StrS family aminotransferase [Halalkalicoccus jeotgali]|uniref:Glutamine--scyllo-inositol transaminase n=1 Tax=Halalkalicoccus jeotgali (strain DSM 18796 / CECT 7217 / JCM 14584 / KCTC 4019 / B3) TaxID=795797 RepID=D8J5R6_HALJB|nr:DegT/DnrJ/EryC1/StrS family aminotransferase [Halalkalicoccus jeotgali]ADJ13722.1 Glutamine--scyllo-inositol transaminase [Halalkalicoccus jeotgali B3]ELY34231.1 Glutamine--scyllo-inositol transaminase [Halalkalicoccus jeotgali B3]
MIPIANPDIGDDEREAVDEVLESGYIASGDVVTDFEAEFADFCGADRGVATANGTAALHAACEALDVRGEAVITTPFSFVATGNSIRLAGGEPVFADIDPETYTLDPDAVESILREREDVAAIMPVHLYGLPADMERFVELGAKYDVAIIEDAAQAHGASVDGTRVGSLGDVACFSFYPTKNMTTGEGGMVTTDDPEIETAIRQFINHGRDGSAQYAHTTVGHNLRLTNIAAALGRVQLERLPKFTEARRENARLLDEGLVDTAVETPTVPEGTRHVYHQYTVRTEDRDALQSALEEGGVDSKIYYPTCIHELAAYEGYSAAVPNATRAAAEVLSLPVHPNVSSDDVDRIVEAVADAGVQHV